MKKSFCRLTKLSLAIALAMPATAMATNGYFAHGYGTKNKGLAGGGVALPQDAMIAATNPAGMVFVGERMDLGAGIFSPSPRSYTVNGAAVTPAGCGVNCPFNLGPDGQANESDNDFFLIPHFAYNWMLGTDSSVGLTVYGNGGMNTEYNTGNATISPDGGTNWFTLNGTYGAGTTGVNLEQLFINASYCLLYTSDAADE